MFPGFSNWKTDMYMDITEGFTSAADKEEFTADELDKLNSIVNAEEELATDLPTRPQLLNNKPTQARSSSKNNNKGDTTATKPMVTGMTTATKPMVSGMTTATKPMVTGMTTATKPMVTGMTTATKPMVMTTATKPMVMEEEDIPAVMEEEVTTQPNVMEEESQAPAVTTKEGFVGSQIQEISAMRLLLIVIALTATCFIVNLPETGKLIRQVVGDKYCLLCRLLIFAGLTYLILLVKY